jgi:diguanylate cyclase (GGDEF)-like protein
LQTWNRTTVKSLLMPGGVLLLGVAILVHSNWITPPLPALSFLYYCAVMGGMLLAWRFHSSRIFFALLTVFLAEQAVAFLGAGQGSPGATAWTVLEAVAVLVSLNFVAIAFMQERGFTVSAIAPMAMFLFMQSVIVVVLFGAGKKVLTPASHVHHISTRISLPGYALLTLAAAAAVLLSRTFLNRKPADGALFWSLAAFFLSLQFALTARLSTAYSAAAAFILAASIVENSYLLAYHDELTALPSRRAFNDALSRLQIPYAIAVVDVDHFKRFNDTYGHDIGDQVLRLVAAHLARTTGGGQAFRCGGEEFTILFPGKTSSDVVSHLEHLRTTIASSEFRLREDDRRRTPRGPDRRSSRGRARTGDAIRKLARAARADLSVRVSIGVADSAGEKADPNVVLKSADKALYRAKANGRNRLEVEASTRRRVRAAGIA